MEKLKNSEYIESFKRSNYQQDNIIQLYLKFDNLELVSGFKLLEYLLAANLKFGDMDIFHYYQKENNKLSRILFSVANISKPGSFDIEHMHNIECHGLVFFMPINYSGAPLSDFKVMHKVANFLANKTAGKIFDEQMNSFDKKSLLKYREKLHKYTQ